MKTLLIVSHTPSPNTQQLLSSILKGAESESAANLEIVSKTAFEATAEDVLNADAIILGTTENLGYMSGALKDFFDRTYYSCLDKKQGLPCTAFIRAGHDGTGTQRSIETITTGLRWRWVQPPLILKGDYTPEFETACEELGTAMACALDAGII